MTNTVQCKLKIDQQRPPTEYTEYYAHIRMFTYQVPKECAAPRSGGGARARSCARPPMTSLSAGESVGLATATPRCAPAAAPAAVRASVEE